MNVFLQPGLRTTLHSKAQNPCYLIRQFKVHCVRLSDRYEVALIMNQHTGNGVFYHCVVKISAERCYHHGNYTLVSWGMGACYPVYPEH